MGEDLLLRLAEKGLSNIQISTIKLAKELNISQQTISRKLMEMERSNLISRRSSTKGITIDIQDKGIQQLKQDYHILSKIFCSQKSIKGKVQSGLGEGSYYVNQYIKQIQEKLNLRPFPGTLNVKVDRDEAIRFLSTLERIQIDGFSTEERTFGSLVCYKILINDQPASIVIPERTRYDQDIIEIIAENNLRKRLDLKDNNNITITR